MDPYAKAIGGRDVWGKTPDWNDSYQHRARLVYDDFDWENDRPLEMPIEDLVIYEMHVRSFTRARIVGGAASRHVRGHARKNLATSRNWASTASNCCRSTSLTSSKTAAPARSRANCC